MKLSALFSCFLIFMATQAMTAYSSYTPSYYSPLKVGYYKKSCPMAEELIRSVVKKAVMANPGIGAGLVRMHFHDCFVRGCEASILLDSTPGHPAEKDSPANNPSLRGFDVIDKAKALVEAHCPSKVSCADIVAYAARDASYFTGGKDYKAEGGRRDGTVSIEAEVLQNLPAPTFDVQQLTSSFASKGLSQEEMVILSGAHTIGRAHCAVFSARLYNFSATQPQDPSLDKAFAAYLKKKCPNNNASASNVVPNDYKTPNLYDNQYYKNAQQHKVLFTSDQTLQDTPATRKFVAEYASSDEDWLNDFTEAMIHMGTIQVLTGNKGEIRKNCRVVNK